MVEAAGIEPASGSASAGASTCLAFLLFLSLPGNPSGSVSAVARRRYPLDKPYGLSRGVIACREPYAVCPGRCPLSSPYPLSRRSVVRRAANLGCECHFLVGSCLCPGFFTRPTGDLGMRPALLSPPSKPCRPHVFWGQAFGFDGGCSA